MHTHHLSTCLHGPDRRRQGGRQPLLRGQAAHAEVARHAEAEGLVLLKNRPGLLPLTASARSVLVIGGMANRGVWSGGGSAQVLGVGGPVVIMPVNSDSEGSAFAKMVIQAGAPKDALQMAAPKGT